MRIISLWDQSIIILLLCTLHYVYSRSGSQIEGATCKVTPNAKYTCKKIQDCETAFQALREDDLQLCGYAGFTPILCCKPEENILEPFQPSTLIASAQTRPVTSTTLRPSPLDSSTNKPSDGSTSISKKKCAQYAAYVLQDSVNEPLAKPWDDDDNGNGNGNSKKKVSSCAGIIEPLIVGGKPVQPREFPHQVNIGYLYGRSKKWKCGGSLISENFVLSAAHCSKTIFGPPKFAVIGDLDINSTTDDAKPEEYRIVRITDHPKYNPSSSYYDIALYQLDRNVVFDAYKRPACLNAKYDIKEDRAIATGWGNIKENVTGTGHLLKVTLDLITEQNCSKTFSPGDRLRRGIEDESMICAGSYKEEKNTCYGDSGGPLQIPLTDPHCMYSIIGVTSFGDHCGIKAPGVYTRVSYFVPWIESIVWPNQ